MVLDMAERHNKTDEPELDTWQTLLAVTGRVLRNTNEQKQEERSDDRRRGEDNKRDGAEHRDYVDRRLKDFEEFERAASGGAIKRRKY